MLILVSAVLLILADHLYQNSGDSLVPGGPLDETAHIATVWLILMAGPAWARDRFFRPALIGAFTIDVDHAPGALGFRFFTAGTPRPYTHSLLTLVLLVAIGLVWRRRRNFLLGLTLGVTLHFFRDLAEGNGSGIALLWPFSDCSFSYSHTVYIWIMVGVIAFDLAKTVVLRWSGESPISSQIACTCVLSESEGDGRTDAKDIRMGSRWRMSLLDTDAIYEVVEVGAETVLVKVIEAPGLRSGMQLRLMPDAFRTMQQVAA